MRVSLIRHRQPARPQRRIAVARRAAVLAAVTGLVIGLGQPLVLGNSQAAPPPGPGRTDVVSAGVPVAGSPDVSADGRVVSFAADGRSQFVAAEAGAGGGPGIFVRDLASGRLEQVAAGADRFAAPSMSADGRLVAYASIRALDPGRADPDGAGPELTELAVVDRSDPEKLVTRQITGGAGDLPYQRTIGCAREVAATAVPAAACGPEISADGRAVAFPARFAVPSPRLDLYVTDDDVRRDLATGGRSLPVLALRAGDSAAATTLHVAVTGPDPVAFTAPSLAPGGGFALVPGGTSCGAGDGGARLVRPGFTCTIEVSFSPGRQRCEAPVRFGSLATAGPTAGARTAVALVGIDSRGGCPPGKGTTPGASPGCGPDARAGRAADAVQVERGGPAGAVPLGEVEVGASRLVAVPLAAREFADGGGEQVLGFTSAGCDVSLVTPRDPPPGAPPCEVGARLVAPLLSVDARVRSLARATVDVPGESAGCVAYLRLAPGSVRPHAAALVLQPVDGGPARVVPVAGAGAADVVLLRRAPAGSSDVAAPGTSARVVSVDGAGDPLSGAEPSVSADGRHVAFTSPARGPGRQVRVHDTDALGDGSYRPGGTSVVSYVADGRGSATGLPAWAGAPALSGDGRSVAFEALPRDAAQDRRRPSACVCTRVYVRDIAAERTYPAFDAALAGRHMEAAALSDDGSTLAFRARPGRPQDAGAPAAVLVRDLAPLRARTGGGGNDEVPLDVAGADASRPALDAHGGVVALQAVGVPGRAEMGPEQAEESSRVLVRSRYGSPRVRSSVLDFGRQETGTQSRLERVTVHNDGPGPLRIDSGVDGPFVIRDGCGDVVLHRGESCVLEVSFAPTEVGRSGGSVALTTTSVGAVVEQAVVEFTGLGIAPVLQITPKILALPRSSLGIVGESLTLSVRNVGPEPVAVTALSSTGEFTVRQGCQMQLEPGGAPCLVEIAFRPGELGRRTASLAVRWAPTVDRKARDDEEAAADGRPRGLSQLIPMESETLTPALEFGPAVVSRGRVTTLTAQHLPPGDLVRVEDAAGELVASGRPDAAGVLRAPILAFGARPLGPWLLTVRVAQSTRVSTAILLRAPPLLVVPGTFQPPDFARRR